MNRISICRWYGGENGPHANLGRLPSHWACAGFTWRQKLQFDPIGWGFGGHAVAFHCWATHVFASLIQPQVLVVGLIHMAVSTVVIGILLLGVGFQAFTAVLIAIALGFSSTVLTAKSLDARNELDSYHGRLAIGILILQDVVAILLLTFAGGSSPTWWAAGLHLRHVRCWP